MYLFCKFGFLYIRFTLSFSTEAFWAVAIMPPYPQSRGPVHTPQVSSEELPGQNCAQMQREASGGEGRLTAVNIAWNIPKSWVKKNHNCLCWNEAVFMFSSNGFLNGSNWKVFCNLWNSVLCFVKRLHEMVGPWNSSVLLHLSSLNFPLQAQRKKDLTTEIRSLQVLQAEGCILTN